MKEFEAQKIKTVLKGLLKRKKITYEGLAESLECSVPTVTRFLGPEELTLTRLLQICEILQVDLADVQNLIASEPPAEEKFTAEQEVFLAKNKNFFAYLMKLFSDETPKQIAEKNKLTSRSTDKYLIGLEKHKLIRVSAKQKVRPAFKTIPMLNYGPLGKTFYEAIIKNAADFFITRITIDMLKPRTEAKLTSSKFSVQTTKVTRASYEAWAAELEKAERAFLRLADFEQNTKPDSELMTAVFVHSRTLVNQNCAELQILDNTFGQIPNL